MLRKMLKALAWTTAGLAVLAAGLYVAAVVANLHDRPPSADALRLAASYEARPALADDDNAFVYLLGFDVPLNDDPRAVGSRRLSWLQQTIEAPFDRADDPQSARLEYRSTDPMVEGFLAVCGNDSRECALAFADDGSVVSERWSTTHPWLLERYLELIAHPGWREAVFDTSRPLPSYASAVYGQRLLLLRANWLAENGDVDAARELLSRDARFWRTVLASSDLLITKMIATAALRQHFSWGSLGVRDLPAGDLAAEMPAEWRQPLTDSELSLRRTLAGEWIYFSNMPAIVYADLADEQTFGARLSGQLLRPLFQEQDTLNTHAAYLNALGDTLEAPLGDYARVADDASELARRTAAAAFPPRSLYNVVGALVMAAGPADYGAYAGRVADLEGVRRAALATVTFRSAATPVADVAAALAASSLRNPYDDTPLRWDADDRAVVFVGLEPGERGEHRFYY